MSARDQRPLAAFFDLFERVGGMRVARAVVEDALGEDARRAIEVARVIVAAKDVETLPCAHGGECTRQVRAIEPGEAGASIAFGASGGKGHLVALCGKSPPECDPGEVTARDVATVKIDATMLLAALRVALHIEAPARPPRAAGEASASREPIAIGVQERTAAQGGPRDAFFAARPEREITRAWLALRERAPRAAVVLVPTLRRVEAELVAGHGDGDRVEIVALEDALGVEGDAIVRRKVARLRVVGPALETTATATEVAPANETGIVAARSLRDLSKRPPPRKTRRETLRKTRDLELPPIRTWRELGICLLEPDTVRLDGAGKYVVCTAHDLGFASTKGNRRLLREWEIVVRTCTGRGLFEWPKFDARWDVTRKYVSNVGLTLKGLFGIDEVPYEEPGDGVYRAKFRAWEKE